MRIAIPTALAFEGRQSAPQVGNFKWIGWIPLALLPTLVAMLRSYLSGWACMWLLGIAIFAGCKWQSWWAARLSGDSHGSMRDAAYLFLWPGMDAQEFLRDGRLAPAPRRREWIAAAAKTIAGAGLIWIGVRSVPGPYRLLSGWVGMVGLILLLHFGLFHLIALCWQCAGVNATPIMREPFHSESLGELWGKRWNLGFRQLSHTLVFHPLRKRIGGAWATLAAFLVSGLIHDFVISFPARAGYGLPTAYFLIQGLGVVGERSSAGKKLGMGAGRTGWLWTAVIAAGPAYGLFHPWFVTRVILPFLRAIGA
jgi:hypothetical protein